MSSAFNSTPRLKRLPHRRRFGFLYLILFFIFFFSNFNTALTQEVLNISEDSTQIKLIKNIELEEEEEPNDTTFNSEENSNKIDLDSIDSTEEIYNSDSDSTDSTEEINEDEINSDKDSLEADEDLVENQDDRINKIPVESDSVQKNFTLSCDLSYANNKSKNGANISNNKPVGSLAFEMAHSIGLAFNLSFERQAANKTGTKYNNTTIGLQYSYSVFEWLDFDVGYSRMKYNNDTLNILSGSPNQISLSAFIYNKIININSYYNYDFGSDHISYYGLRLNKIFETGNFTFIPMLDLSFSSYIIDTRRLTKKNIKLKTITGNFDFNSLNIGLSADYEIFHGFNINLSPSYNFTSSKNLLTSPSQFIISLGLGYNFEF